MNQQNSSFQQQNYLIPFPYQVLTFYTFNQPYYSPESQNHNNFSFFPSQPPPTSSSLQSLTNQTILFNQASHQQILPTLQQKQALENLQKRERHLKKLEKKNRIQSAIHCNCSKTGCLKEYCRCYRMGKICSDACNCLQCRNSQKQVFAGKKKRGKKSRCSCKKTMCNSKYCDCLAGGGRCGSQCTCINCQNE